MIIVKRLATIICVYSLFTAYLAQAHDSHTHKAPWQACKAKQKAEQCSFNNGEGDLHKGTCQLFNEALLCVRNEPIIYVKALEKIAQKNKPNKTPDELEAH